RSVELAAGLLIELVDIPLLWAADSAAKAPATPGGRCGVKARKCGYYSTAKSQGFRQRGGGRLVLETQHTASLPCIQGWKHTHSCRSATMGSTLAARLAGK